MRSSAPHVQIHGNFALANAPVRRPRRTEERRSFSTGLMLLNVTTWAYAIAAGGVNLA